MSEIFRRILHRYRYDLPLHRKLLISNLFVIVIPLAILALFASAEISRTSEQRARFSAEQALEQADSFLSYTMYNVARVSEIIFVSPNVNAILRAENPDYPIARQLRDGNTLRNYLFSFQDGVNVDRIRLYLPPGFPYAIDNVNLFSLQSARGSAWYHALEKSGRSMLWCSSSLLASDSGADPSDRLSLARFMVDQNDLRRRVGVLRVDFSKKRVAEILKQANAIRGSVTYVVDAKGDLVAASGAGTSNEGDFRLAREAIRLPDDGALRPLGNGALRALVGTRPLPDSNWRMATVIPLRSMIAVGAGVRNGIFVAMIIVMIIATFLAYLVSGSITRRISQLIARMQSARGGGLTKLEPATGSDEVGQLHAAYNEMTDRIHALIEEEAQARQLLKSAELEALQAQINPHFLYNTLDLINWLTRAGSAEEVESVVRWLADFYRISLSDGRTVISIGDELEHVTLYYSIQNLRFRGALTLTREVEDGILSNHILKTTLQPLVENAILHGIRERPDKRGNIWLSGRRIGDDILLSVGDDGVGIPVSRTPGLLDETIPPARDKSAFGLRNIHERLRLKYGLRYGLSIASVVGEGTTVTVRIKAE